ncbi:hypothetical protein [Aquiflexum sp.]|uniref:hypothetical protein n=1 Tax=Aquiflexum sp. TaxID=1872584 RepID=UPI003593B269
MKKGILHLMIFSIPVFLGLVVIEMALRNVPNTYKLKNDYLIENSNEIEVLILGNSQTFYGLDPQFISAKAFNAAHISQLFSQDKQLWEKYFPNMPKLKYLVISFSIQSFYDQGGDLPFIHKNYVLYYGFSNQIGWKYGLELTALPMRANLIRLIKNIQDGEIDYPSSPLGFGLGYKTGGSINLETNAKEAIARHLLLNGKIIEEELKALEAIVRSASQKEIQTILLATPVSKQYYSFVPQTVIQEVENIASMLSENNQLVTYMNWNQHPDFRDKDFYDADHLNDAGARKLSLLLDKELDKKIKPDT